MRRLAPILLLTAAALAWACETYEPPPTVTLEGLSTGILDDPRAPLLIDFGMPIDPASAVVTVAFRDTDGDGNLPDEGSDPTTALRIVLRHGGAEDDRGVVATFEEGDSRLRLVPNAALPVGPKLVLLVEPGLRAKDGRERRIRTRVPFSYSVKCPPRASPTRFQSGTYFLLLQVDKPLGTQIQLFGAIDVEPSTGVFKGQFTKARRNPDGTRCPTVCPSTDACRLLPRAACVAPSTAAGTVDEFPDWVPNATPPTGYSFEVRGCAVDDGDAVDMLTAPATLAVEQPKVTVQGLIMTAQFAAGPGGVMRATGSLTADTTLLGTSDLGPGKGSMAAVRIKDELVPPGVPRPQKDMDAGR